MGRIENPDLNDYGAGLGGHGTCSTRAKWRDFAFLLCGLADGQPLIFEATLDLQFQPVLFILKRPTFLAQSKFGIFCLRRDGGVGMTSAQTTITQAWSLMRVVLRRHLL